MLAMCDTSRCCDTSQSLRFPSRISYLISIHQVTILVHHPSVGYKLIPSAPMHSERRATTILHLQRPRRSKFTDAVFFFIGAENVLWKEPLPQNKVVHCDLRERANG